MRRNHVIISRKNKLTVLEVQALILATIGVHNSTPALKRASEKLTNALRQHAVAVLKPSPLAREAKSCDMLKELST